MKRKLTLLAAVVCICAGGGGVANAQLYIDVYRSQDHTNQTLWIFSGSSSVRYSSLNTPFNQSIRSSATDTSESFQDTWEIGNTGNIFNANQPSGTNFQLSSLLSSTNTIDIASVRARIPGGGRTNITFAAAATNTPTITISSGSRTISHMFLDADNPGTDDLGIRVSGSNLNYSSGNSSAWAGAGILNKPIGDFLTGEFWNQNTSPLFAASSGGSVRIRVNSQIIPEPEEYALIFGLFALGFVFFRRHFQKKQQRQAQTATTS